MEINGSSSNNNSHESSSDQTSVIDIYPLSCYYFGSKDAIPLKEETLADRILRRKSKYAAHGLRTCVEAVILIEFLEKVMGDEVLCFNSIGPFRKQRAEMGLLNLSQVELFKHPHLLLLQVKNSIFKLPGGRIRPGESDIEGLKRKLMGKLSLNEDGYDWEVAECLGMWWKPDFETLHFPYLPPNVKNPKECTKLYLVKLPVSRKFIVPKNLKLLAVPLCQIHGNHKTYGPIISGVPQLLSKFSFNIIDC